jgi:LEA14-like dessication related protein
MTINVRRFAAAIVLLTPVFFMTGCAAFTMQSPAVTVSSLKVIEAGLLEQRFLFKLRVQNPNDYDISVRGMNFEVTVNDEPFVKGVSDKPYTLTRLSETMVEVAAVSDLSGIIRQIGALREGNKKLLYEHQALLSYRIRGRLITGLPVDLNFENSGTLNLPVPSKK